MTHFHINNNLLLSVSVGARQEIGQETLTMQLHEKDKLIDELKETLKGNWCQSIIFLLV